MGSSLKKKAISIFKDLQKVLDKSEHKPNKIWVDQGSEFYNNFFKKWLKDNDIKMSSTHHEGKSVVAERFIRTLKNKIYKHMKAVSKNVYVDKLDDTVREYNNTYHRSIKIKPVGDNSGSYIKCNVNSNEKDPKFQVGDHVIISKYKNVFAKGYTLKWSEEVFVIKNVKNTAPWTYVINDLNGQEIETLYEKELKKINKKKKLRI